MTDKSPGETPTQSTRRTLIYWLILGIVSVVIGLILDRAHFPAAFLIGPMACAIVAAALGAQLAVHVLPVTAAQAMLGLLIASSLTPSFLPSLTGHWILFLGIVIATLAASSVVGYLISRWKIMPGTSGI